MNNCPFCDGPGLLLGVLGNLLWLRCRNCGCEFHITDDAQPTFSDSEEDDPDE